MDSAWSETQKRGPDLATNLRRGVLESANKLATVLEWTPPFKVLGGQLDGERLPAARVVLKRSS